MDNAAKTYNWNDISVVGIIANRLRGMARRWYDSQEHLKIEWNDLKSALIEQFHKPFPFSRLLWDTANYEVSLGQELYAF